MFDTMTMTKVGGALCGALLIFLLINMAGDAIYSTETGHGEHAEATHASETETESHAETDEAEAPAVAELVAAADTEKGAKAFSKCKACHKLEEGKNGVGPSLFAIVDSDIAAVAGFKYTGSLTGLEGNWTIEALDAFLTSPKKYAPGTKMTFKGLKKPTDRANLIAYLQTISN